MVVIEKKLSEAKPWSFQCFHDAHVRKNRDFQRLFPSYAALNYQKTFKTLASRLSISLRIFKTLFPREDKNMFVMTSIHPPSIHLWICASFIRHSINRSIIWQLFPFFFATYHARFSSSLRFSDITKNCIILPIYHLIIAAGSVVWLWIIWMTGLRDRGSHFRIRIILGTTPFGSWFSTFVFRNVPGTVPKCDLICGFKRILFNLHRATKMQDSVLLNSRDCF